MQELKAALVSAEVENPIDMERIKFALQGYNFGNGYISWAKTSYGGYSNANVVEFSAMQAQRLGWEKYGDTQYPAHVLRYYPYRGAFTSGGNQAIVEVALIQLGNEGGQPYWSWYGFGGRVEWCACSASWCADQCGYLESGIIPKFPLCSDGVNWFKGKGQWQDKNYEPQAGDLIFFDGGATAQSTMWESWRNARMGRSTPWRAILAMPANSRAIQTGATLSTVTDALPIYSSF